MSSPAKFAFNNVLKYSNLILPGILFALAISSGFSASMAEKIEIPKTNPQAFRINSPAFAYGEKIPERHTCDGINVLPPLNIENIPAKARTLALIMDDPDAPTGSWTHLALWNMPAKPLHIEEAKLPRIATIASNDFGNIGYGGPCPPRVNKITKHHYYFKAYALDGLVDLPRASKRKDLDKMMAGHIMAKAEYMGTYERVGASLPPKDSDKAKTQNSSSNTNTKK